MSAEFALYGESERHARQRLSADATYLALFSGQPSPCVTCLTMEPLARPHLSFGMRKVRMLHLRIVPSGNNKLSGEILKTEQSTIESEPSLKLYMTASEDGISLSG